MTDRCEPPEHLRGVDGLYWVCGQNGEPFPAQWFSAPHSGQEPLWRNIYTQHTATPAWAAAEWDWRYLAPVATVEELVGVIEQQIPYADEAMRGAFLHAINQAKEAGL
jgi:hypothetical protein